MAKNQFLNWEKVHEKFFLFIWFHEFFCLDSFEFSGSLCSCQFQIALYCRLDLNVRSTTHLLLAFAAIHQPCRPFLPRYFSKAVVLPTDWTSVADLVQTFVDSDLHGGSLPAILRKCMVEKFKEFDEYQLGKNRLRIFVL